MLGDARKSGRHGGYTLIEIMGAFLILTVILAMVTGMFVENGRQREAAIGLMRERLAATGALERLAEDLESAIFVMRAEDVDPRDHPWSFLSEGLDEHGATALRFVTQNAPGTSRASHASGWAEVAYFLAEDRDGSLVLWRWRSPRPPSEPARGLPSPDAPGSMRLAEGVASFGLRFLDHQGQWLDEWDSTFLPPGQALPRAVDVTLAVERSARPGEAEDGAETMPGLLHKRRVAIPMFPIDVARLVQLGSDGEGELDCFTVAQCLDRSDVGWYQEELDSGCGGDDALCDRLADPAATCWSEIESGWPAVAQLAPGCAS